MIPYRVTWNFLYFILLDVLYHASTDTLYSFNNNVFQVWLQAAQVLVFIALFTTIGFLFIAVCVTCW